MMGHRHGSHYSYGAHPTPRKRLALGFIDQGIVSGSGLVIFIAAAQFLSPDDLGYFSFGVATCLLVVSLARALCGESLLVRTVGKSDRRPTVFRESRSMLGLATILGFVSAFVCGAIGLVGDSPNWPLLASAIACPGLVLQDSLRFVFISMQRTTRLVSNDIAALLLGATAIIWAGTITHNVFSMLVSWGLASMVVSIVTLLLNAIVPSLRNAIGWLRDTWRSSSAFFTENALGALAGYTIVVILTVFIDPSEVAAFRATLVVYGVASLVVNFLRTQVLRELRPEMIDTVRGVTITSTKLAAPVIITITGMLLVLLLIPAEIGEILMRDTWSLVVYLLIPGAINRMFAGFSTIPAIILRVQGVTWKATAVKVIVLVISLILSPLGALYAGAAGALYAETLAYGLSCLLLFVLSARKAKMFVS